MRATVRRDLIAAAQLWTAGLHNSDNDPALVLERFSWAEIHAAAAVDRDVWECFVAWQRIGAPPAPEGPAKRRKPDVPRATSSRASPTAPPPLGGVPV